VTVFYALEQTTVTVFYALEQTTVTVFYALEQTTVTVFYALISAHDESRFVAPNLIKDFALKKCRGKLFKVLLCFVFEILTILTPVERHNF
jgi:hypothetical protein